MKKRAVSMMLVLAMLVSVLFGFSTTMAFAASSTTGTCGATGSSITYVYDETTKTLTLTGSGTVKNYNEVYPQVPWKDFKPNIENIVIGEGITQLGQYNFFNCVALKSVSLPSTLKVISGGTVSNAGAFSGCTALENITLPNGLEKIEYNAFYNCTSLKSITFPDSLTTLESTVADCGPFSYCTSLTTVTYGRGLTETGAYVFANSGVKYINFSDTITKVSQWSFFNTRIVDIEIPETITAIGTRAFANCEYIISATVYNPNCEFQGIIGEDPFNNSNKYLTMKGHSGSTTQTYAEAKGYAFESIDPCDHINTHQVLDPAPTCTESGTLYVICDDCGFVVSTNTVEPTDHIWTVAETEDLTEENGHLFTYYVCDTCGETKVTVEHLDYVDGFYTVNVIRDATCTTPGAATKKCNVEGCSKLAEAVIIPRKSHTIPEYTVVKEPTCTEDGEITGHCTACDKDVTETVPATGHTNELTATEDNTDVDGHTYEIYSCTTCGEETLVPTHVEWVDGYYTSETVIEPTCVVTGYRKDTCDICGEVKRVSLPKREHDYIETSRTEPTCTAVGKIYYACQNEGCTWTKSENIPALGHDLALVSSQEPTCTTAGYNSYKCQRSGCSYSSTETVAATGHTADETNYTVVTEPTCEDAGLAKSVCTVCSADLDIKLEALGHNFEDVFTDIEGEPGHSMRTPTCTRCGQTDTAEKVHNEWVEGYYTVDTKTTGSNSCTAITTVTKTCTICNKKESTNTQGPGHSYAFSKTLNNGTLVYTCSVCSNEEQRSPSTVSTSFPVYINKNTADTRLGYVYDINLDGIVNAKDYALINKAVIISKAYQ